MQALKSGKTKSLYPGPEPNTLRMVFRDEVTAQDGKRREEVPGKGTLNAQISAVSSACWKNTGSRRTF